MELSQIDSDGSLAPQACTLEAPSLARRVAEFDALFAEAVRDVERTGPGRLRLDLEPSPQVAGRAAELVAAETGCCSFFTFTLTATAGRLVLEVTVPAQHIDVLDAMAKRAAKATGQ